MSISQMKATQEKSDEFDNNGVKTPGEQEGNDDYSVEYEAQPAMDDVDLQLLERFLRLLEQASRSSDDVSYDDLLTKQQDNKQPENVSSGIYYKT